MKQSITSGLQGLQPALDSGSLHGVHAGHTPGLVPLPQPLSPARPPQSVGSLLVASVVPPDPRPEGDSSKSADADLSLAMGLELMLLSGVGS